MARWCFICFLCLCRGRRGTSFGFGLCGFCRERIPRWERWAGSPFFPLLSIRFLPIIGCIVTLLLVVIVASYSGTSLLLNALPFPHGGFSHAWR